MPGPKARSHARPARHALGRGRRLQVLPQPRPIDAQRGRDAFQPPSFDARTICPAADRIVSTRGRPALPPHDLPRRRSIEPSSSGISSRSSDAAGLAAVRSACEHLPDASSSQRSPSLVQPGLLDVADEPTPLGVGDAVTGPGLRGAETPRGNTNSVRRMARCLTSDRSTYSARSRSATAHAVDACPGGQVDRRRDRCRAGRRCSGRRLTTSAARWPGARRWRRASRAPALRGVDSPHAGASSCRIEDEGLRLNGRGRTLASAWWA